MLQILSCFDGDELEVICIWVIELLLVANEMCESCSIQGH